MVEPSTQSLPILADSSNGTLFYDVDAKTHATINDFGTVASTIVGKYVRIAARYQSDGSLVAVRMWASSSFAGVWLSPEGHVLHVDTTGAVLTVQNELGLPVPLTVDGTISGTNTNGFTYTQSFHRVADDYTVTLPYLSGSTANGSDPQSGAAINGFKW
jgi:hypothetical protein